jgi:ubiquinone biosynthesis protein
MMARGVRRARRPFDKLESRSRDIERIVKASLQERREHLALVGEIKAGDVKGAVRAMPRRKLSKTIPGPPPEAHIFKKELHHASPLATVLRCLVWLKVFLAFLLGVLWDKLLRRNTVERRAARFLHLFQTAGGSFHKIGQQLAMRVDLLPYEYCRELSKLLDAMPPFKSDYAIKAVERATGKPLGETFALFDPKPIGSASIACVFQGVLKNGDKVAVKVRRPGIGKIFAADLRAMGWMISFLEACAILRAGYMDNFVQEFSHTILEELDFRMEGYHQAIFRREARNNRVSKTKFFTAPRTYYELSSQDVLIEEFVSGIWMWEIMAAVESNDKDALARMRQLNIDPKLVAERLFWIQAWGQLLTHVFHADPHPANIVVQKNSKLVFVDFGACGSMSSGKQHLAMDYMAAQVNKDIAGCVRCLVAFMEPLPPIDLHKLMKELEIQIDSAMQRIWSKHAPWYEKTSASIFFKVFEITRKYNIPVNLDTVRLFRANMLYDTLALRVHPGFDPSKAAEKFLKDYDRNFKTTARDALRSRLKKGLLTGSEIAAARDAIDTATRSMQLLRRILDRPLFSYGFLVKKSVATVVEIMRLGTLLLAMTLVAGVIIAFIRDRYGLALDFESVASHVFNSKPYYAIVGVMTLVTMKRIMMRLSDQDLNL